MARATLPQSLPGRWFVLRYERETRQYTIELDAPNKPTFILGQLEDMPKLLLQFRLWGYAEFGAKAMDVAREWRTAACILATGAVARLPSGMPTVDIFAEFDAEYRNRKI